MRASAFFLGAIHRHVGGAKQRFRISPVTRTYGDPDAGTDIDASIANADWAFDSTNDPICEKGRSGDRLIIQIDAVHDQGELVASQARHRVATPDDFADPGRDLAQDIIACLMTVDIVDRLETVQVEAQNRELRAATIGLQSRGFEHFGKDSSVGQAGEGVVPGK